MVLPISTTSLQVHSNDLLRILLRNLTRDELQEVYDYTGARSSRLAAALHLDTSPKTLRKKLAHCGVNLSAVDAAKAGISSRPRVVVPSAADTARVRASLLVDSFDPEELMKEAAAQDLDPSIFRSMDTKELPRARNIHEWITGRDFLNANPFPRQLQILLSLLEEYCVFCSDTDFARDMHLSPFIGEDGFSRAWTNNEILERVVLTEHGVCPRCARTYHDMLDAPGTPFKAPNELAACVGMRAGKTRMSEMLMTYINHRYQLLTPSPQQHFGEDPTQQLTAFFTAIDLSQSADTLWGAYHIRIQEAPWYQTYHKWLDEHGKKIGLELYRIMDTYHSWSPTLLQDRLKPPFAKALRGRTGYQMGIDEIGMFSREDAAIKANAGEVLKSMSNALMTIRNDVDALNRKRIHTPPAPMVCISSPWELLDKIMQLVRTADKNPRRVAAHYATWEMNPKIRRDSPQILAAYSDDPIGAERDFGAIPPMAVDPFHANSTAVDSLVTPRKPQFVQQTKFAVTPKGAHFTYAIPSRMVGDKRTPRILTIDGGETNNSWALSMWSLALLPAPKPVLESSPGDDLDPEFIEDEDTRIVLEAMKERERASQDFRDRARARNAPEDAAEDSQKGFAPYLACDAAVEVQPFTAARSNETYKVHFGRMYDACILPVIKAFNILAVITDRWNISQTIHALQDEGVRTHQYSLVWDDFVAFREKVNSREVRLLEPERPYESIFRDYDAAVKDAPFLHLMVQLKTVRKVGRQVQKPRGGTDDLYRTMVLAHRFALNEDPRDVAVDDKGVPYKTLMLTQHGKEVARRGLGVVLPRRPGGHAGMPPNPGFSSLGGYSSRRSRPHGLPHSNSGRH